MAKVTVPTLAGEEASDDEDTVAVKKRTKKAGRKARSKPEGKVRHGDQEANRKTAEDDMCRIGEYVIGIDLGLLSNRLILQTLTRFRLLLRKLFRGYSMACQDYR